MEVPSQSHSKRLGRKREATSDSPSQHLQVWGRESEEGTVGQCSTPETTMAQALSCAGQAQRTARTVILAEAQGTQRPEVIGLG